MEGRLFRRFSINFALFSMLFDMLLTLMGMQLAADLNTRGSFDPWLYFLFPLVWWLTFLVGSLYDGHKNFHIQDELGSFVLLTLAATVISAGILYLSLRETARSLFAMFVGFTFALQLTWRLLVRIYWRIIMADARKRRRAHRVLIVGAGTVGRSVASQIRRDLAANGVEVVGFLDDDAAKRAESDVIGSCCDFRAAIEKYNVDEVIIALPARVHDLRDRLVTEATNLPVQMWIVPDVFRLALYRSSVEDFAGMPLVGVRVPTLTDYQRFVKRGFDLVLSFLMLVLSAPLMLIAAITIKLDSPGSVIFRQKRIGENGRVFTVYKFRTMVRNAEALQDLVNRQDDEGHTLHKSRGDPRVTKVGQYLRATSIDELPQLVNVLKGDMSMIGPRPELPALVEKYETWQRVRLTVPPGLTGWWQIHGRSDRPMHLHTEDDIYYVKNYSIWLDIYILLRTVLVLLRQEGAY